ncbi:MAG: cytochrome c-type biogenesis protein CcmH [Proteobacteria bacterium]|nr:cytochrome c-type biogenesis protein CcmH [Pseudomonadota bacterium]
MRAALALCLMLLAAPALAVKPSEQLKDPAQEARARALSAELRCLVCQNQSIDDSDASLAQDLRRLVRERITAGDNDSQIRAFLVARYGEFVLLKPPVNTETYLLWGLPGIALVLGAGAAWRLFRRRRPVEAGGTTLSNEEKAELDALLARRE